MRWKNKKKYGSFHNYIMKDPKVYKYLFFTGQVFPLVLYSLLLGLIIYSGNISLSLFIGIFWVFSVMKMIKFFRLGGLKAIPPTMCAEQIWSK